MKKKDENMNLPGKQSAKADKSDLPEYPLYPGSEDIYNKSHEEKEIDPEDTSKTKEPTNNDGLNNEKDFDEDVSGGDLDVPGSELDDEQENVGSEDEENNYYSIGGDDHENLDENK